MRQNRVLWLPDTLERDPRADAVIDALGRGVRALPLGRARDVLHGRWLGRPAHPLTVQVPIGTWMSAAVLGLRPGRSRQAGPLVGVGPAAAGPAALAGAVGWAELHRRQTRAGLVQALANATAVGLYGASLLFRLSGRAGAGRACGFLGLTAVGPGGVLGGHTAYRQASGANQAEEVPHIVGQGRHRIGTVDEFPVGRPVRRTVDDVPVLVVRETGGAIHVPAERCSHLAGPLSEGTVTDGCVRYPWHGSVSRLSDGWNVRGPATAPQPAFDSRVVAGHVEAGLCRAGQETADGGETDEPVTGAGRGRGHGRSD